MRRAFATLLVTAAVTALLVSFKAQPALTIGGSAANRPPAASTPAPAAGAGNQGGSAPPRTVKGPAVSTPYGTVQVAAIVAGGKLQDVRALALPTGNARSDSISSQADPLLRQEAVAAQSGTIDTISGASYTSEGYRQSLQGALVRARS